MNGSRCVDLSQALFLQTLRAANWQTVIDFAPFFLGVRQQNDCDSMSGRTPLVMAKQEGQSEGGKAYWAAVLQVGKL